jgi:hypothetical protein
MAQLPDKIMVGGARASVRQKRPADEYVTHMSRRLKVAIESLTTETVAFRKRAYLHEPVYTSAPIGCRTGRCRDCLDRPIADNCLYWRMRI